MAEKFYADIAINGNSQEKLISKRAISKLTNQELLLTIVKTGNEKFIREEAVRTLTDIDVLTKIINGSEREYMCTWEEIETDEVYPNCYIEGCYIPACGRDNCNTKTISYTFTRNLDLRETARKRLNDLEVKK